VKRACSVKTVLLACFVMNAATACSPFTKIEGDKESIGKINGSWTVMWSGGAELKGVEPVPTIVFNTSDSSVSGFDGCNNFKGTYSFVDGQLKAKVTGTRKACPNETARAVSAQMENLFTNGAEVVETALFGANLLRLKNSSAELRLGPSDKLK